jgi:hypothetical protein
MQAKIYLSPSMIKDFIRVTSKCDFDIDIASYNKYFVDAKSIVGVLGLDMTHSLTLVYNGYNEELEEFIMSHRVAC